MHNYIGLKCLMKPSQIPLVTYVTKLFSSFLLWNIFKRYRKKWYLLTLKKICCIECFEKIELEMYNSCLELYKLPKKFTEGNARYLFFGPFYGCDGILFHDYQSISRQISNQLARGHKTISKTCFIVREHHFKLCMIMTA